MAEEPSLHLQTDANDLARVDDGLGGVDSYQLYGGVSYGSNDLVGLLMKNQTGRMDPAMNGYMARGAWTQQEDDQLMMAVTQLGPNKWIDIAKFVPTRTGKQCRERWHQRLSPTLKREPFEAWEDQIIISKQKILGNRWAVIAHDLPGRSAAAIKNRWYSGLRSQHATQAQLDMHVMNMGQMNRVDSSNAGDLLESNVVHNELRNGTNDL